MLSEEEELGRGGGFPRRRLVIDSFSYLDYKEVFGFRTHIAAQLIPSWVQYHDFRRLQAYTIYESYCRNISHIWTNHPYDELSRNRREYGDPSTIVNQILASLIGDDQTLSIPQADGMNPDDAAIEQRNVLKQWMDDESFILKMIECERHAVKLGDGVYVLGWDEKKQRPRLRVYNPGFYFPVLEEGQEEDFPDKVHIAWEFEEYLDENQSTERCIKKVRRKTWELVTLAGGETRNYKWNLDPSNQTVLYTDGTWLLQDYNGTIQDLDPQNGSYTAYEKDLEIDFIPVVHIPCFVSDTGEEHFGKSALAEVLQILDDLVATDTDLQAASSTTGTPPIALSGASAPKNEDGTIASYGPGTVWETGDGTATVIDTSHSLDALTNYKNDLLSRLAVNSHVPEALLGRIKPNEVPSGISLTLSFAPHSSMIREMRLIRADRYGLLVKFVARFFQQNGDLFDIFPGTIHFGSFLPSDRTETQVLVTNLLNAKAISLETAVRMLMNAGYPIEDATDEINAIIENDFDSADKLLTVTGDIQLVRDRLGLPALPEDIINPPAPAPAPLPPGPVPGPGQPPGLPPTVPQPAPVPPPPPR